MNRRGVLGQLFLFKVPPLLKIISYQEVLDKDI